VAGRVDDDTSDMRIDLGGPRIIDLDHVGSGQDVDADRCDLCRREEDLYRLFSSPDALCRSCFAMWHG
jgi:hypothetical protein